MTNDTVNIKKSWDAFYQMYQKELLPKLDVNKESNIAVELKIKLEFLNMIFNKSELQESSSVKSQQILSGLNELLSEMESIIELESIEDIISLEEKIEGITIDILLGYKLFIFTSKFDKLLEDNLPKSVQEISEKFNEVENNRQVIDSIKTDVLTIKTALDVERKLILDKASKDFASYEDKIKLSEKNIYEKTNKINELETIITSHSGMIEKLKSEINEIVINFKKSLQEITDYNNELQGQENDNSIENKINKIYSDINDKSLKITSFYDGLFSDDKASIKGNVDRLFKEINDANDEINGLLSNARKNKELISKYNEDVHGDKNENSLKNALDNFNERIESMHNEISSYYNKLININNPASSIQGVIESAKTKIEQTKLAIENDYTNVQSHIKSLMSYYDQVYGKNQDIGLKKEVEQKIEKLDIFEDSIKKYNSEQKEVHENLKFKINDLLHGATNVALAHEYQKMNHKIGLDVEKSNTLFKYSIFFIIFVSIMTSLDLSNLKGVNFINLSLWPISGIFILGAFKFINPLFLRDKLSEFTFFKLKNGRKEVDDIESIMVKSPEDELLNKYKVDKIWNETINFLILILIFSMVKLGGDEGLKFIQLTDFNSLGMAFIMKLPFLIPLSWLAIFASRRRSEYLRLQQEYAHKEAMAKSYMSFKEQTEKLEESLTSKDMMKELLKKSIETISFNAATTLDSDKHKENMPITEIIDKLANAIAKVNPK